MYTVAQTKRDIFSILKGNEEQIKTFGVKKLGLFSSFVRQEQGNESDIDLLVEEENNDFPAPEHSKCQSVLREAATL